MKIDGKAIAEKMLADLAGQVAKLKEIGVTPTMVVILVGDNPASLSYIKQKEKAAERIGAKLILKTYDLGLKTEELTSIIKQFNTDPSVHGIIIQRPLPESSIDFTSALHSTVVQKDIDGFMPGSPFEVPVANAVFEILDFIRSHPAKTGRVRPFQELQIVVIGRGETAGKPIADLLIQKGCNVTVVHSQTTNPDEIIKSADIVISCVGKPNVVRRDNIKKDVVLISVGIWRDTDGKLHGDYDENAIADVAIFFTPTPGGVGPVNVACLMQNLVKACTMSL